MGINGTTARLLWFGFWGTSLAFSSPGAQTPVDKPTDDDLRIRGVFDSALPGTEHRHTLRLIVHPHFGDLHRRDFLRMPVGLRYGVSDKFEVFGEAELFFAHGLGDVAFFDRSGLSNLRLGAKYQLGDRWHHGWNAAIGFDANRPVGRPPVDITDGRQHVAPYVSFSHRLERAPDWRVFWSAGYDAVGTTHVPGRLEKNQLGRDAALVSGGALWERGTTTWTLEASWLSSRIFNESGDDLVTLRPGVVWMLPPRLTFGARSRWFLGIGVRLDHGRDGFGTGVNAKLRGNFDIQRLWRPKPSPGS